MFKDRINPMEVRILVTLTKGTYRIKGLAEILDTDKTWISKCVSHLHRMGFISVERSGQSCRVSISSSPLGNAIGKLVIEDPLLNLEMVLAGYGLRLLVLLLPPGMTVKEMTERSGLTSRTIRKYIGRWRELGVVRKEGIGYSLHPFHGRLLEFIRTYCEHRNIALASEISSQAILVWQDRDEMILSSKRALSRPEPVHAGPTALASYGEDIVYSNKYYFHSRSGRKVSREEAHIQALVIDPAEPRIRRSLLKNLKEGRLSVTELRSFAGHYGIDDLFLEVIENAR